MSFHKQFQERVDESGLSQERIARLAQVDPRTVRDIYRGVKVPTPWVLRDILETGLGLSAQVAGLMESLRQVAEESRRRETALRLAERKQRYQETEGEMRAMKKMEA